MKFQQLRYLVAVVEAGNVTEAARRLNVTQPALSAGLAALEAELGGPLIERQRGQVRLTDLGRRFHRRALNIVNECERAKVEFQRGLSRAFVTIGTLSTIPMPLVLQFLRDFTASGQDVDVSFQEGDPMTLLSWLSRGRIDLAVTISDLVEGGNWVELFEDPFVLLCGPDHALADARSVRLADLGGEAFVLRNHCERAREASDIMNARGVRTTVVLRTDQDQHALEAVRAGIGVTVAPRSLARDLQVVAIEDLGLRRTVGLHVASWLEPGVSEPVVAALRAASQAFHPDIPPPTARRHGHGTRPPRAP